MQNLEETFPFLIGPKVKILNKKIYEYIIP
jgi:hypothetical protein